MSREKSHLRVHKGQSCLISLPQLLEGGNKDGDKLNIKDLDFQKASLGCEDPKPPQTAESVLCNSKVERLVKFKAAVPWVCWRAGAFLENKQRSWDQQQGRGISIRARHLLQPPGQLI